MELWNKDVAEVFLNPQPERLWHYYEFEVAPNNQWIDLEIAGKGISDHDAKWNPTSTTRPRWIQRIISGQPK